MTDVFRLVTIDPRSGKPTVVEDLNSSDGVIVRKRDTFRLTPPGRRERTVAGDARYEGSRVIGVAHDNASIATGLLVKGATAAEAAGRVEQLLAYADRVMARDDLYAEWQPAGLRPVYFPIRGPGTIAHAYNPRAFEQASAHELEVTWPVAPLAEGLPMDALEDFTAGPSALDDWTIDADNAAITVDATGLSSTVANGLTKLRHTGRGYGLHDLTVVADFIAPTPGASLAVYAGKQTTPGATGANLHARVFEDGTSRSLRLYDTALTQLATVTPPPLDTGRRYWLVFRIQGRLAKAELWDREPQAGWFAESGGVLTTTSWVHLTAADHIAVADAPGEGIVWWRTPDAGTVSRLLAARVLPYTFPLPKGPAAEVVRDVPGNAPAKFEAVIGASTTLAAGAPFGLIATRPWMPHNMVVANDAEAGQQGWFNATIGGGIGASGGTVTSEADTGFRPLPPANDRTATKITAPATALSGGAYRAYQRIRRGRVHTIEFYYWRSGGSWEMDLRLDGNPPPREDGSSIVTALPATSVWTKVTTTFVPTSSALRLEAVFRVATAVAANLWVTEPRIYEGTVSPDAPGETEDRGAYPPFGVLFAEADLANRRTGFVAAVGIGPTGRSLNFTGSGTAIAEYAIDPDLIDLDDDSSGELDIEVWAHGHLDSGAVTPRVTISHAPLYGPGPRIYSRDYGSAGKPLANQPTTSGNARTYRLGTLTFVRDGRAHGRRALRLQFDVAAGGSFTSTFAYLVLVPIRRRAATPSGKVNDSTYPAFFPPQPVGLATKRIGHDGRGTLEPAGVSSGTRDSGLGGAPLELVPGDNEILAWVQTGAVPDDPVRVAGTVGAFDAEALGLHVRVTPRYRLWRDD